MHGKSVAPYYARGAGNKGLNHRRQSEEMSEMQEKATQTYISVSLVRLFCHGLFPRALHQRALKQLSTNGSRVVRKEEAEEAAKE
jgi:hypothetical protein